MLQRYLQVLMSGGKVEAPAPAARPLEDGLAAFSAGDYATAEGLLLAAGADHPDDARVNTALGLIALEHGRPEEAIERLLKAKRRLPTDLRLLVALADAHTATGDLLSAVAGYQAALRIDPAYATAQRKLGEALMALGRMGEALQALNQAVYRDRTDVAARLLIAKLSVDAGDDARAMAQLTMIDRVDPQRPDVQLMKADIHQRAGDFRQMAAELEVVAAGPQADLSVFWRLGNAYLMFGRREESLGMFQRAAQLEGAPGPVHLAVAQAAEEAGRHQVALQVWKLLVGSPAYRSQAAPAVGRIREAIGGPTGLTGYLRAA